MPLLSATVVSKIESQLTVELDDIKLKRFIINIIQNDP